MRKDAAKPILDNKELLSSQPDHSKWIIPFTKVEVYDKSSCNQISITGHRNSNQTFIHSSTPAGRLLNPYRNNSIIANGVLNPFTKIEES